MWYCNLKVILLWCKLYVHRNIINYKSSCTFRNSSLRWKYKLNLVMIVCFNVLVVPVLFQHSLKDWDDQKVASLDHIFDVEPLKITSPSSDAEVALALRVLEGCCLLHRESSVLAHQHKAIQVIYHLILAASADSFIYITRNDLLCTDWYSIHMTINYWKHVVLSSYSGDKLCTRGVNFDCLI